MNKSLILLPMCLMAFAANSADWSINNTLSKVSFISTKKVNIAEVHSFNAVSGTLSSKGEFELTIPLNTVSTGIEIRNQRMQTMLFEVNKFPQLVLKAKVNPQLIDSLSQGETLITQVNANINLHGIQADKEINVVVTKLSDSQMQVTSFQPIIVNANDFGLAKGIEKLQQVAGLSSISLAVPVSFVLSLSK
ncbi:YceI family protein [Shewanella intestini]|nr:MULTISPECIES: YceI family protein [Shewanella]